MPETTEAAGGRFASPQARSRAETTPWPRRASRRLGIASDGIANGSYDFNARAPKQSDIAREIPVRNNRPFSYSALELKNGDIVLKKLLTGGFAPPQPGDGSFTKPMKLEQLSVS